MLVKWKWKAHRFIYKNIELCKPKCFGPAWLFSVTSNISKSRKFYFSFIFLMGRNFYSLTFYLYQSKIFLKMVLRMVKHVALQNVLWSYENKTFVSIYIILNPTWQDKEPIEGLHWHLNVYPLSSSRILKCLWFKPSPLQHNLTSSASSFFANGVSQLESYHVINNDSSLIGHSKWVRGRGGRGHSQRVLA